ncbi:MAG: indole-3-glycerol phosphate synthase TrpC [Ignavibacteriae bacterium]|nr:indole-3-glycerol phosphate synthase TrpC [Ignavibacteriota bacterium]MCB9208030.1 indole-3-glycerol phosphate synthase TrpC [Ignavibacteriales bacterium]MCB9258799.1 indole-3-glycerol phosphate synthase TrpC [Ignavibacteriales bacterium]
MTILEEINEVKKEEVKKLRQEYNLSRFTDSEFFAKPKLSFYNALNRKDRISIIAEIKKASPSKGIIKEDFDHLKIADIYMENEIDAISILTDVNFFKGNISYLNDIAKIKTVPLLRKDFIIDEFQIYEAKANGADVILLIAESLSKNQISELTAAAKETDLEVLLELHSEDEFEKIDFNQNQIIGINNRDLKTFNVDLNTTKELGELIPKENLLVAESGIKTEQDLKFIKQTKAKAILVGEHLMSSNNISDSVKELKEWCFYES